MKKEQLSIGILSFLLLLNNCSADPSQEDRPVIDNIVLSRELVMTWYEMLADDHLTEETHQNVARNLYGLVFIIWLTSEHFGINNAYINQNRIPHIVTKIKPYVDFDDPLGINKYYDKGALGDEGVLILNSLPLQERVHFFDKKINYDQLVVGFKRWSLSSDGSQNK